MRTLPGWRRCRPGTRRSRSDVSRRGRAVFAAIVAQAALCTSAFGAADEFDASFDYLYVEANEGSSSGGHTAVRFGAQSYHFQNRDGLLVLDREFTADLLHDYALLNNRTVRASRVALREADLRRLHDSFERRYHRQSRQLEVGAALRDDLELLDRWREGAASEVPGLGYFERDGTASPAVRALRDRLTERYGIGFLTRRRDEALAQLAELAATDPAAWPAPPPEHASQEPPLAWPWARRYQAVASSVAAVDLLHASAALDATTLVVRETPSGWLVDEELRRIREMRARLEDSLVRLAGSPRSDWGRPFLVGLARLLALDEALARRRLVVLDTLPADAHQLPYRALEPRLERIGEILLAGHARIEMARRDWSSGAPGERPQTRLEGAINRVHELEASVREQRALRLAPGNRVPARPGPSRTPLPKLEDTHSIDTARARVASRIDRHAAAMTALYRYHLITRNCVSELFETLNAGLGDSPEEVAEVLGGHLDGHSEFGFVPFVSARAVDDRFRVVEQRVLPSFREMQLAEMRRHESPAWVALRESNTLTARSYQRGYRDSAFLFFTDDRVWLRPVLGVANLTTAVLESLWGVVKLPADRGETLRAGLTGTLVSLPELAFFNIRKGSNDWVMPSGSLVEALDRPLPAASADATPADQSVETELPGWSR